MLSGSLPVRCQTGLVTTTEPLPAWPGPDDVRALARSAPWLFRRLHFTHHDERGGDVEAWLERPWQLRVRTADGEEHDVSGGPPYTVVLSRAYERTPRGLLEWARDTVGDALHGTRRGEPVPPVPPQAVTPERRPDGLVLTRPTADYDDPMWQSYRWVAMLDPVELSEGVDLRDVTAGERQGRRTWWATAVPQPGYDPRCGCCPLLLCAVTMAAEFSDGAEPAGVPRSGWERLPTTYRVGLDVATGVVVAVVPLDGEIERQGFSTDIHAAG